MDTLEDAARSESIVRVRQVLDGPSGVSQADLDYALIATAGNRGLDIAMLLLNRGAAVDGDGNNGNAHFASPLHQAVLHCNVPLVHLLLARGADINRIANGRTPLSLAAGSADHLPVLQALLDAGADPNAVGTYAFPLAITVLARNEAAAAALLASGADPNMQTQETPRPLHLAATLARSRFVETLLAAGADPNLATNRSSSTPLHHAALADGFGAEAVRVTGLLLRAGADPLARGGTDQTPLRQVAARAAGLGPQQCAARAALGAAAALLVAAGDSENMAFLPTPCPRLEAALVSVWQAAPEALPALFARLEPWVQESVRCLLRMSHRYGLPKELRWRLVGEALGDARRDLGLN